MPDVIGYELEKALHILNEYNFEVSIKETFGKRDIGTGEARVVRQRICKHNILQLVIAYF
ncbi:MAG: PASTA domain-containing protein [Natronincolaceae bacterium]|nr:PASTA domain-containing protein [Bacillota bacterium]NLK90781.1 hypothetical protein [Clostridiales bacterium]